MRRVAFDVRLGNYLFLSAAGKSKLYCPQFMRPLGAAKPDDANRHRNGSTAKTVLTGHGPVRIETPCDREGSVEPVLLPKSARRLTAFNETIIGLYVTQRKRANKVEPVGRCYLETIGRCLTRQMVGNTGSHAAKVGLMALGGSLQLDDHSAASASSLGASAISSSPSIHS
jgi:hypothetical protein